MSENSQDWDTRSVFPPAALDESLSTLWEQHFDGGNRTRLAIIKLCHEGEELADLSHCVRTAKLDFRDVPAWADHPSECASKLSASAAERSEARALDQYIRWLERDLTG